VPAPTSWSCPWASGVAETSNTCLIPGLSKTGRWCDSVFLIVWATSSLTVWSSPWTWQGHTRDPLLERDLERGNSLLFRLHIMFDHIRVSNHLCYKRVRFLEELQGHFVVPMQSCFLQPIDDHFPASSTRLEKNSRTVPAIPSSKFEKKFCSFTRF